MDVANTFFLSSIGANPKESMGAGVIQKTPIGSFSVWYVPANAVNGQDDDLDGLSEDAQATAVTNKDRASAYEFGFIGDLGVKGLQVAAFKNKEKANAGSTNAT